MLERKRIVVTGAGRGIGAAIAATARSHGAEVFTVDVDPDTEVDGRFDVSDEVAVDKLFEAAAAEMGGVDGLVNNVGIPGPTGAVETLDPAAFDRCLTVNVGSTFRCTARAVPLLSAGSSIVNIVSTAGIFGYPLRSAYVASKWAVVGLTKTWAMELGQRQIRVNAVCPGTVSGPRMDGVIEREATATGATEAAIRDAYTSQVSMGAFVTGEDIGEACAWLLSSAARYVSGQVLSVDGNTETLRTI